MTSEMAFECLLISQNVDVLRIMSRLLELLSIQIRVCMTPWRALQLLPTANVDLIVLDCDQNNPGTELLEQIWHSEKRRKPTILAITTENQSIRGAHVALSKPLTVQSGAKSLGLAYAQMLYDYRLHSRHALMLKVVATNQCHQPVPLTVTDIGSQGVGIRVSNNVKVDDRLSFDVNLPNTAKSIHIEARIVWSRQYGDGKCLSAGCEFVRIPPGDAGILDEWCRNQCKIKSPTCDPSSDRMERIPW